MNQTLKIILASALATTAVIKAVPAFAEAAPAQNVSIVRIADLDLSTAEGRRQLDQRLVVAARDVCGTASDADLAAKNDVRRCRANVLSEARAKGGSLAANKAGEEIVLIAELR